jgi:alpha-L-fucosidase
MIIFKRSKLTQNIFEPRILKQSIQLGALLGIMVHSDPLYAQNTVVSPPVKSFTETSAQHARRMAWWREARFGMFIHWGLYSVPAGEWNGRTNYAEWILEDAKIPVSRYEKFADEFNPTQFDANAWVKAAKDAGMKYIVITSKHHDGFGLFPSKASNWNIARTPFKRDPLKELASACKEQGMKLCFYHSIMDWHSSDYAPRRDYNDVAKGTPDMDRYEAYLKAQLKELLTNYGPIGLLWFDGEWEPTWTNERAKRVSDYIHSIQPNVIVNNRLGKARNGMAGMSDGEGVGDYGTPEQTVPAMGFGPGVDWESCMTMNDHWGYNKTDDHWKSSRELIRTLIDCASKGGNYLLNVGPTAQGTFPAASVERLKEIGSWMKVNGDGIYGTTASPFKKFSWGRATMKRESRLDGRVHPNIYLHVFDWPTNGELLVPGLKTLPTQAYQRGNGPQVKPGVPFELTQDGLKLKLPVQALNPVSSTIVLAFDADPVIEEGVATQKADGTFSLFPVDATIGGEGHLLVEKAANNEENLGYWDTATNNATWTLKASRAGKIELHSQSASLDASVLDVSLGGQTQRITIPQSGAYDQFKPVVLGVFKIPKPGLYDVKVAPVINQWKPVNLRQIEGKPIP